MKKKFAFAAGLLAVSVALVLVSAPKANAWGDEVAAGRLHYVATDCVCPGGVIVGHSNDCTDGRNNCADNDCSHVDCPTVSTTNNYTIASNNHTALL